MPLSVSSMKTAILDALSGTDNANDACKKFGDAILKNICDDISIMYGWGVALAATPFTPDPIMSFEATVSGGGTLTPSDTLELMLVKLGNLIKGLTISASGFNIAPLIFNPVGVLSITMANENTQDAAMTSFCTQLIASIRTSFVNPAPASGTHGPYVGATIGMVIL